MSSEARLRWVVETLDPAPGADVLELGSGNGVAAAGRARFLTGALEGPTSPPGASTSSSPLR